VDALWTAAYGELKQLARSRLRRSGPHTLLDTTALVNDSYLKLISIGRLKVENRRQFFAYASQVMRSVIVSLVREKLAEKHGGQAAHITLNTEIAESAAAGDEPLKVDEALSELAKVEPRLAQVVEMRYFAGLTEPEIAEVMGVTDRTVRRDWDKARVLLRAMLVQGNL
jgi:RNA polymerase sigma factor (TIGR02999 family)